MVRSRDQPTCISSLLGEGTRSVWSCLLKHPPPQTSGSSLQNECQPALFSVSDHILPPLPTHGSATAQWDPVKDHKGTERALLTFLTSAQTSTAFPGEPPQLIYAAKRGGGSIPGLLCTEAGGGSRSGGHGNPGLAKMDQGQGDVPLVPFQEALVTDERHAEWTGVVSSYTFTPVPGSGPQLRD